MIKAVLDTNILISAAICKGNEFEILRLANDGRYRLILSVNILEEFEGVISRSRFGFTEDLIENIVDEVIGVADIIETKEKITLIEDDPDDNKFLECALEGNVDYIISGDEHLLRLKEFEGIKIMKSREFLDILVG